MILRGKGKTFKGQYGFRKDTKRAIVTLEEGVNMPTRIIGIDPEPENLKIGMDLVVDFIDADGQNLPVFRPA